MAGKDVAATVVDHVVPHKGDLELFWDQSNWQGVCKACHDSSKKLQEHRGFSPAADVNGNPLDASHPWNSNVRVVKDVT
jgi:5-methylcytosine-specific restriction enzyme A